MQAAADQSQFRFLCYYPLVFPIPNFLFSAPRWSYLRSPDRMKYTFDKSGVTLRGSEATLDELKTVIFFG
ncbi:hypothetical protein, partial [Hominenteromicrobium sp.]|uniref:hypothetical protein n=1 Tax=Hominenteromicrobium sp. TaxID=3073581 RepID=UPI003A926A14